MLGCGMPSRTRQSLNLTVPDGNSKEATEAGGTERGRRWGMSLAGSLCPQGPISELFPGRDVVVPSAKDYSGLFCNTNKKPSSWGLTAMCTSAHWNEGDREPSS